VANKGDEARRSDSSDAAPALRTTVLLRERQGNAAVGRFYEALGTAIMSGGNPPTMPTSSSPRCRRPAPMSACITTR
jgi:hypothetical protein